jgi:hypothetical protein
MPSSFDIPANFPDFEFDRSLMFGSLRFSFKPSTIGPYKVSSNAIFADLVEFLGLLIPLTK